MVRKTKAKEVKKTTKVSKKNSDLIGKIKASVEDWVKTVKGKIEDGVDMFSDEIDTVKKTWFDVFKWIKENRNIPIWIVFLAIWLWKLWGLIVWWLLIVIWVLFLTWYIGDWKSK